MVTFYYCYCWYR